MKKEKKNYEIASKREKLKIAVKSKLIRDSGKISENYLIGTVISVIGNTVLVSKDNSEDIFECSVSGRVISKNKKATLCTAGDRVKFLYEFSSMPDKLIGRIIEVEERLSRFSRKSPGKGYSEHVIASNLDNVLFVKSVFDPVYNKRLIDRMIIAAEIGGVKPALCINKIDLTDELELFKEDLEIYTKLGIPIFFTSTVNDAGFDEIKTYLKNNSTLFFGPSGVGKSSILNILAGDELQKVREISERTGKGQHTTSFVKMIKLDESTFIFDSPGIREFAIWDLDRENLAFHFHDFDKFYPECRFKPCTHTHEPNCAVIEAVEKEMIDPERYDSYLNIYDTIEDELKF